MPWLRDYNYERPHQGYRNLGKRPLERLHEYAQQARVRAADQPAANTPVWSHRHRQNSPAHSRCQGVKAQRPLTVASPWLHLCQALAGMALPLPLSELKKAQKLFGTMLKRTSTVRRCARARGQRACLACDGGSAAGDGAGPRATLRVWGGLPGMLARATASKKQRSSVPSAPICVLGLHICIQMLPA